MLLRHFALLLAALVSAISAKGDEGDEIDETAEYIADTEEDFDLMCDGHVAPNRTNRLPDVIIIGIDVKRS